MTAFAKHWRLRLLVAAARIHQAIGWPGAVGVTLMGLSCAVAWSSWLDDRGLHEPANSPSTFSPQDHSSPADLDRHKSAALHLPPASDTPLLLKRLERTAVAQGLGWPRAEYRYVPASADAPSSIEVRCTLKGTYPQVRRFVGTVLRDIPAAAMRELHITRPGTDVPTVDARLVVSIFVADDDSAATLNAVALAAPPPSSVGR